MVVPMMLVLGVICLVFGAIFFGSIAAMRQQGGRPDADMAADMALLSLAFWAGLYFSILFVSIVVGTFFVFAYPLIVDHDLSGYEAILLSAKAVFGNLGGMFGLMALSTLLSLLGMLACYVGAIFVLPLSFAMVTIAYDQVFPMHEPTTIRMDDEELDEPVREGD